MKRSALACIALSLAACTPGATRPAAPAPLRVETTPHIEFASEPAPAPEKAPDAGIGTRAVDSATAPAGVAQQGATQTAAADAPTWDISVAPYEANERVAHYVARYTGPARAYVEERLARGTRYEAMIREKFRAGGLPEDMYYLAFVESGFDAHAYSRAAAAGMWQFMPQTAKWMKLRVDWWVDERRDPVRSTDAAVRFLAALHDQFGSFYLAAAAYNGGPNRVARGLSRFAGEIEAAEGEDRFFALSDQEFLPRETREYVPQIIAAAMIGNDPDRYGMRIEHREPFTYDSVAVPALTSLAAAARAAGTDLPTLGDLNPQLIRGITPPRATTYLRIPAGSRPRFDSTFARLDEGERMGVRRHVVKESASLASLARELGTTPRGITAFNPNLRRTKRGNIAAGQTLFVADREVAAVAFDIGDPAVERGRGHQGATRHHVVASGETLSHISRRYGVSVATLMRINGLTKPLIRIGQQLAID